MPRDHDASNPVAFNPVPPTVSVAVPGYISALLSRNHQIWVHPTIMESCSITPDVIVPLFYFDHVLGLSLLIQFPPEMDENWVRYGLAKFGQISKLPNWQKIVVLCVHNTTSALNS